MNPLSTEELNRIERFVAAFNGIDDWLQAQIPNSMAFRAAVDFYASRNRWWSDAPALRTFAALRNFLVHEKTAAFEYPCVPSENAVQEIEAIRARLTSPPRAGELFARAVRSFETDDFLDEALREMARAGYGVFPVFNKLRFVGLLTPTGIARWLAQHVDSECFSLHVALAEVLPRERQRATVRWAKLQTPVAQLAFAFGENTFLEAILLSDDGRETTKLRGIVTRGDVAGMEN